MKQRKTRAGVIRNLAIQTLFQNRIGEKILKAVYSTKDYSNTSIIGNSLYLGYHLKGRCFKSNTCYHVKSYAFILNNMFKKFIHWAWEIIRKNNLESEKKEMVEE